MDFSNEHQSNKLRVCVRLCVSKYPGNKNECSKYSYCQQLLCSCLKYEILKKLCMYSAFHCFA